MNREKDVGVSVAKVLACSLEESELEFQSSYYVHFRTNTLGEVIETLLYPPAIG